MKDKKNQKDNARPSPMKDSCCTPNTSAKKPQDVKNNKPAPKNKGGKV